MTLLLGTISINTILLIIQIICGILDVAMVIALVVIIRKCKAFRPPYHFPSSVLKKQSKISLVLLSTQWRAIRDHAQDAPPHSYALAIIEADKLVDNLLIELGYQGETMAERMKKIKNTEYPSVEGLWRAHKIRNEIAHTSDFILGTKEAENTLHNYEQFLKEFIMLPL